MTELYDIFFTNLNAVCHLGDYFKATAETVWIQNEHRFSQNKFYCITKGRCQISVNGKSYLASSGDWFLIPANTLHSYRSLGVPFEKYWMHFDLYPTSDLFRILNLPDCVNIQEHKQVKRLFSQFIKAYTSNELTDRIKVKSFLLALVAEYIAIAKPETVTLKSMSDSRIDDILHYIHSNLDKSLTNTELADLFHLHPNHLIRFFKNKTGQTPARYVKIKKMEAAKRLLEDSELYINEIMERIGETDLSSFSKQFKSFYNLSPREYRKFFRSER